MSCRGLGSINVGPLAQAQFSGQINPSFLPQQTFEAGYSSEPQDLPLWDYATPTFAQQIASLLGGSVLQAPPPGNYQGTDIPNANWVSVDGAMVLPGNLFQPGTVLSFEDECAAEQYFAASIPGGQESSTCQAGGSGTTPTQLAVSQGEVAPVTPSGQSTIVGYTPAASPAPTAVAPVAIVTPTTPAASSAPPAASQVVSGTPGSNVGGSNAGNVGQVQTAPVSSACFNPLNAWLPDSCLGPLGIFEWLIAAGLAWWFLAPKGR